jgi:membrane protein
MQQQKNLKNIFEVIKKTFEGFGEYKIMKLSASLAYTTIFSMAPLLVIILFLTTIFFQKEAIEGTIYNQIKGFVGEASALQVQSMIKTSGKETVSSLARVISVIGLIVAATSLFVEIQDSINTIWGVRPKKGAGIIGFLKTRLISFGVIGSLGFLLLVTLSISTIMDGLSDKLTQNFSSIGVWAAYILNILITLLVVSILFAVIFKMLPDAEIKWNQVRMASVVTAILFMVGKFLISVYITKTALGSTFGAAGSLVVLLVWVYYSSVILYLGASFAKQWALAFGSPILPSKNAQIIQTIEITTNCQTLQQAENEKETIVEELINQAKTENPNINTPNNSQSK